jgi:hypothetical protein
MPQSHTPYKPLLTCQRLILDHGMLLGTMVVEEAGLLGLCRPYDHCQQSQLNEQTRASAVFEEDIQMKARRHVVVLAVLVALIPALWAVVQAADKTDESAPQLKFVAEQRDSLRGLQGVNVIVESLTAEAEQLGLTREALQIDTELQLRQYGIKVLTREEWVKTPGSPFLYVNVTVAGTVPIWAVSIKVQLRGKRGHVLN